MPPASEPATAAPAAERGKIWICLGLVALAFIGSRAWLLWRFEPQMTDLSIYTKYALAGMDFKAVAYRDFQVEYPPLAWWLMASPRLLDSKVFTDPNVPAEVRQQFVEWMFAQYRREFLLIDVVSLLVSWAIGRLISPLAEWLLPAFYTSLTIAQPHVLYDRLDLGLTLLLLAWIYCWLRSLAVSSGANYWACASYLFLGLGFSYKILPVVCIPFVLLADLWASRSVWRPLALLSALAIGGLGPFAIQLRGSGWQILTPFRYHAEREIHLESIWGSIMLVARSFGVPSDVIKSHGGCDLTGPWYKTVKAIASGSLLASGALCGLWAVLRWGIDRRTALDLSLLVLINSMVLSHVFSPQYLNWMLPVVLILALDVFDGRRSRWGLLFVLAVTIVGISTWIFPHHFWKLQTLSPLAANLSIARSGCLVMLALLMNVAFFGHCRSAAWPRKSAAGI